MLVPRLGASILPGPAVRGFALVVIAGASVRVFHEGSSFGGKAVDVLAFCRSVLISVRLCAVVGAARSFCTAVVVVGATAVTVEATPPLTTGSELNTVCFSGAEFLPNIWSNVVLGIFSDFRYAAGGISNTVDGLRNAVGLLLFQVVELVHVGVVLRTILRFDLILARFCR